MIYSTNQHQTSLIDSTNQLQSLLLMLSVIILRVQVYSKEESHILLPMEIVNKMVTFKTDESVLQNHSKTCICEVKENELNFK